MRITILFSTLCSIHSASAQSFIVPANPNGDSTIVMKEAIHLAYQYSLKNSNQKGTVLLESVNDPTGPTHNLAGPFLVPSNVHIGGDGKGGEVIIEPQNDAFLFQFGKPDKYEGTSYEAPDFYHNIKFFDFEIDTTGQSSCDNDDETPEPPRNPIFHINQPFDDLKIIDVDLIGCPLLERG